MLSLALFVTQCFYWVHVFCPACRIDSEQESHAQRNEQRQYHVVKGTISVLNFTFVKSSTRAHFPLQAQIAPTGPHLYFLYRGLCLMPVSGTQNP